MSVTGEPEGAPMKHGVALADVLAGKDAAIAILGALVARATTGEGRVVTVSLEESAGGGARERGAERARVRRGAEAMGKCAREPGALPALRRGRPPDRDRGGERCAVGGVRACARAGAACRRCGVAHERRAARAAHARSGHDTDAHARASGERNGASGSMRQECRTAWCARCWKCWRRARASRDHGNGAECAGLDSQTTAEARRAHGAGATARVASVRARYGVRRVRGSAWLESRGSAMVRKPS